MLAIKFKVQMQPSNMSINADVSEWSTLLVNIIPPSALFAT